MHIERLRLGRINGRTDARRSNNAQKTNHTDLFIINDWSFQQSINSYYLLSLIFLLCFFIRLIGQQQPITVPLKRIIIENK